MSRRKLRSHRTTRSPVEDRWLSSADARPLFPPAIATVLAATLMWGVRSLGSRALTKVPHAETVDVNVHAQVAAGAAVIDLVNHSEIGGRPVRGCVGVIVLDTLLGLSDTAVPSADRRTVGC